MTLKGVSNLMHMFNLKRYARITTLASIMGVAVIISGCAHETASSSTYTYSQAQRQQSQATGTVQSVRQVTIQQDRTSGVGAVAGGAVGGVAGNTIGGGRGKVLTTIGGGLLGAVVGDKIESQVNKTTGLEIVILLDTGETTVVAQAADVAIGVGQRVRVISGGGGPARVVPM